MSTQEKAGFEWRNRFYPWSFTNIAKDQMLLDRITGMPASEFVEMWSDLEEGQRTPILIALIATSLRAGHPEWPVDRIYRTVLNIDLVDDITYVNPGEADDENPPAQAAEAPPTSEAGRSPSNGSSPPSTPPASSPSETFYGTPV